MRAPLHRAALLLCLLVPAWSASAADREYGIAAGLGTPLAPAEPFGAAIALSASASPSDPSLRLVRARGELQVFAADGAWAALPSISGDVGLRLGGRLDLYLTGGFELFGVVARAGYTGFANFGVVGGAGLGVQITPSLRLGLRGLLTYLPEFSTIKLDAPEGAEQPRFLFVAALLSLEIRTGQAADDMDFDE